MKFLFRTLLCSMIGVAMMGCSNDNPSEEPEPDQQDPAVVTYTLTSDKTEAEINEEITFNVISSTGEDVTSDWLICDESFCFVGNVMSYDKAGTHTVSAHSNNDQSLETQNSVVITVKGGDDNSNNNDFYPLNPDAIYEIYTEDNIESVFIYYDEIRFRVREIVNGEVLNDNVKNFYIGVVGSDMKNRFSTDVRHAFTEEGVFDINGVLYYRSNGQAHEITTHNAITLNIREKQINGSSDDYYRRALFVKWTATWCSGCAAMDQALENVRESYVLKDRIVPIFMHNRGSDECYPGVQVGEIYSRTSRAYNLQGIPSCVINFDKEEYGAGIYENAIYQNIRASLAKQETSKTPGIKITTSLSGRKITYKVETSIRDTGEYLLGLVFLENGLLTYQSGAYNSEMIQNYVLHYSLTEGDDLFGLHDCGTLAYGDSYEYSGTFEIPVHDKPADFVLENCELVYFICKKDAAVEPCGYFCANAGSAKLGESTEYEYEPSYVE